MSKNLTYTQNLEKGEFLDKKTVKSKQNNVIGAYCTS